MSRVCVSVRGEVVNFDLLEAKKQMLASSKPVQVTKREEFVNNKLRRRPRVDAEKMQEILDATSEPIDPTVIVEEPKE